MSSPGGSIGKVAYDLRPCKQTERMMMIHLLQHMAESGFKISDYQYTGFGSLFFVDFILLRKMLGIYDMLSAEINTEYESRIKYNLPYSDIDIHMGDIGEVIPSLSPDKKHFLWLDYDDVLQQYMVSHLFDALTKLPAGSIIALTIDVDFKSLDNANIKEWFNHLDSEVQDYLPANFTKNDCSSDELINTIIKIINNIITHVMSLRINLNFELLFNFIYADGHTMLTIGGLLAGREEKRMLRACDWKRFPFYRKNFNEPSFKIHIPKLTRRERLYLDSNMPMTENWKPKLFQLAEADLIAYSKVFNYCPLYGEFIM
jgi:hypothetical protein